VNTHFHFSWYDTPPGSPEVAIVSEGDRHREPRTLSENSMSEEEEEEEEEEE